MPQTNLSGTISKPQTTFFIPQMPMKTSDLSHIFHPVVDPGSLVSQQQAEVHPTVSPILLGFFPSD